MPDETTYLFFNLLVIGLLTSEFYHKADRSQRTGLALGLIFVGLIWSLSFPQSRSIVKRHWLRLGAAVLLVVSLTCTGELMWGEVPFKVIMMSLLIIVGLLGAWSKGQWANFSPVFWLFVSGGAVIATFLLAMKYVDMGAYLGAWGWVILGPLSSWLRSKTTE